MSDEKPSCSHCGGTFGTIVKSELGACHFFSSECDRQWMSEDIVDMFDLMMAKYVSDDMDLRCEAVADSSGKRQQRWTLTLRDEYGQQRVIVQENGETPTAFMLRASQGLPPAA